MPNFREVTGTLHVQKSFNIEGEIQKGAVLKGTDGVTYKVPYDDIKDLPYSGIVDDGSQKPMINPPVEATVKVADVQGNRYAHVGSLKLEQ